MKKSIVGRLATMKVTTVSGWKGTGVILYADERGVVLAKDVYKLPQGYDDSRRWDYDHTTVDACRHEVTVHHKTWRPRTIERRMMRGGRV